MSTTVAALRGAITLERDEREHMLERVTRLLTEIMDRNGLEHGDLISILFTATDDLHSAFPAVAARQLGMGDVPLICARELDIDGGMPRCVRVMIHITTDRPRSELRHVYLEDARSLRDDLPE
ncbi:MAG: chorismate mutase [Actinomycetota bacterium]|nr:chorismate mutase [Actinomycetota bacterium]